jgi:hypothetical protein
MYLYEALEVTVGISSPFLKHKAERPKQLQQRGSPT